MQHQMITPTHYTRKKSILSTLEEIETPITQVNGEETFSSRLTAMNKHPSWFSDPDKSL